MKLLIAKKKNKKKQPKYIRRKRLTYMYCVYTSDMIFKIIIKKTMVFKSLKIKIPMFWARLSLSGCDSYTYGPNCKLHCGHCLNEEPCDLNTGQCQNGCLPGFKGDLCKDRKDPHYTVPNKCLLSIYSFKMDNLPPISITT